MSKIKVLVVEDVLIIQRLLEHILGDKAECVAVDDGKKAVKKFSEEYFKGSPFDLVCLDIFIPEMTGLEVLSYIRKFEDEIQLKKKERSKIVMITSVATSKTIEDALKKGCDGYILKPFAVKDVHSEISRLGLIPD